MMSFKNYTPKFEYERLFQDTGWPWSGHKFFAYDFVRNFKPKTIVELGTHKGTSLWSFSQAVKDGQLETKIFAVDTWQGEEHAGFYGEEIFDEVKKIKETFYSDLKINLLRKTFDEAVSEFKDNSIDLLHIDGLHTYEAVKHDFETWLPKVKSEGVVMFHDIFVSKGDFGVYKLWEELKKKYASIEFHHSFGLGVLFLDAKNFQGLIKNEKELRRKYSFLSEERKNTKLNIDLDSFYYKDREITSLNQTIKEKEREIGEKEREIGEKEREIGEKEREIGEKNHELSLIKSSKFWKLRERYLKIKRLKPKNILNMQKEAFRVLKEKGPKRFLWCIPKYFLHGKEYFIKKEKPVTDYNIWMKKNENWDTKKIKENIKKFNYKPKVSIITPVYNVDPVWLNKCIGSVKNQFYTNWELCLWDDASTKKETIACLKKWKGINDKRIKIGFGKKNEHICGASNNAIKMATGKFIALLDNDDELSPDALYENIKIINKKSEAKFIYSDEDKMELDNNRTEPFFKPNWSPDLLYSNNYICHLTFFKKSLGDKIGWFRKGYEGAQDYDLILRLTEQLKNEEIFHISKILYHWRKIPGSTAENFSFKNYANLAGKKALRDFMKRNKVKGVIESGKFSGSYRIKRKITNQEKVSIIIPFRDQLKVLKKCITSILEKTIYQNFEIVLVNNQSQEKNTLKYLEKISKKNSIKLLNYDKPFNFSAINNYAVSQTDAPYILFLNNDTSVINYGWLGAMIEHIQREEVGAVGAKLLYPNNTIQHAGVVMGLGIASHPFLGFPKRDNGYFGFLNVTKNYSAVTAACLLTKRQLFNELGGFDEKNLGVAYNDVDYCLRLRERGFLITYTPYAKLYHYESLSRGFDNEDDIKKKDPKKYQRIISERKYMLEKWKKVIKNDPYYNPNLTRLQNNFGIKIGPEDVRYI